jgi:hypothetical protein
MLNENSNIKQISKPLEVVSLKDLTIPVTVPQHFVDKVKYLCRAIPKVEWSGVLFFKFLGNMQKPETVSIELVDIYLMDKGSSTYTEYSSDETIVEHIMSNPDLLSCHRGQIHSHNVMNVFFSGTDMSELNDNSEFYNFYLSVIVNNWMDFKAKVAFRAKVASSDFSYTARDEQGNNYTGFRKQIVEKEVLIVYDCNCQLPTEEIVVPDEFKKRTVDVIKKSDAAEVKKKESWKTQAIGFQTGGHGISEKAFKHLSIEDEKITEFTAFLLNFGNEVETEEEVQDVVTEIANSRQADVWGDIQKEVEDAEYQDIIEEALDMLEQDMVVNPEFNISSSIIEQYTPLYEQFFDQDKDLHNPDVFSSRLSDVIMKLEDYEQDYPLVGEIITALKLFQKNVSTIEA